MAITRQLIRNACGSPVHHHPPLELLGALETAAHRHHILGGRSGYLADDLGGAQPRSGAHPQGKEAHRHPSAERRGLTSKSPTRNTG